MGLVRTLANKQCRGAVIPTHRPGTVPAEKAVCGRNGAVAMGRGHSVGEWSVELLLRVPEARAAQVPPGRGSPSWLDCQGAIGGGHQKSRPVGGSSADSGVPSDRNHTSARSQEQTAAQSDATATIRRGRDERCAGDGELNHPSVLSPRAQRQLRASRIRNGRSAPGGVSRP